MAGQNTFQILLLNDANKKHPLNFCPHKYELSEKFTKTSHLLKEVLM